MGNKVGVEGKLGGISFEARVNSGGISLEVRVNSRGMILTIMVSSGEPVLRRG